MKFLLLFAACALAQSEKLKDGSELKEPPVERFSKSPNRRAPTRFDADIARHLLGLGDDDISTRERADASLVKLVAAHDDDPEMRAALHAAIDSGSDSEVVSRLKTILGRLPALKITLDLPKEVPRGEDLKGTAKIRNLGEKPIPYMTEFPDDARGEEPIYFLTADFSLPTTLGRDASSNHLGFFPIGDPSRLKQGQTSKILAPGQEIELPITAAEYHNTGVPSHNRFRVTLSCLVGSAHPANYIWLEGGFRPEYRDSKSEAKPPRVKFGGEAMVDIGKLPETARRFADYVQCALDKLHGLSGQPPSNDPPYFAPCFPLLGGSREAQVKALADILSDAKQMGRVDANQSHYAATGLDYLSPERFLDAADKFMTNCVQQKMFCDERTGSFSILFQMAGHKDSAEALLPMFKRHLAISSSDEHDWPAMSARLIWAILELQTAAAKTFVKSLADGTGDLAKKGKHYSNQNLAEKALESWPKFPDRRPY